VDDAVEKIAYYLTHEEDRRRIAAEGRERAMSLLSARTFWTSIDAALGPDSLL
jgi:hypothetical protein